MAASPCGWVGACHLVGSAVTTTFSLWVRVVQSKSPPQVMRVSRGGPDRVKSWSAGSASFGDPLDRAHPVAEAGAVGELHLDEVARLDVTERRKDAASLDAVVDMSGQHG